MANLVPTPAYRSELMKWSWQVGSAKAPVKTSGEVKQADGNPFEITAGNTVWSFSPENGQLIGCSVSGKETGLANGPLKLRSQETSFTNWCRFIRTTLRSFFGPTAMRTDSIWRSMISITYMICRIDQSSKTNRTCFFFFHSQGALNVVRYVPVSLALVPNFSRP